MIQRQGLAVFRGNPFDALPKPALKGGGLGRLGLKAGADGLKLGPQALLFGGVGLSGGLAVVDAVRAGENVPALPMADLI